MAVQMGKLIRQLRKQQKMTQKALADGIVSESVMSRIENGLSEPDIVTLNELFRRLGKTLAPFEIVVSNREYEMLRKKEYAAALETVVVAESEYFKDIREAKGLSQEKFGSDVYSRETISNIEHGRTPQRKKLKNMLEKQGEVFEKYYGYVVAAEYEIYELAEVYQQKKSSNPEEARKLCQEIKRRIDADIPVNRQFLESTELMDKRRQGHITLGEELAGLEKCLRYTMPEYDGTIYRIPYRQESVILEEVLYCKESLQQREAARYLAREIAKKTGKKLKLS